MFFFGIMGIEDRKKSIKYIQNVICKGCEVMSTYELVKVYTIFHFFFIPLIKFNKKYYLVSRCCNSVFQLSAEIGERIEKGEDIHIDDSYLKEVYVNHNRINLCNNCGREVDGTFQFCPYCGGKL